MDDTGIKLLFDEEDCVNTGDGRGKTRNARVVEFEQKMREAKEAGARGLEIPADDDKESKNWHTFRYRLNAAANYAGIKAKISIDKIDKKALVTFL